MLTSHHWHEYRERGGGGGSGVEEIGGKLMFGLPSLCDNFRPVCMVYFVSVGERREERGAGEGGLCVFMDLGGEGEGQLAGTGRIIRDLMKKQLNLSAGVDPKDLEGGEGGGREEKEEGRGKGEGGRGGRAFKVTV